MQRVIPLILLALVGTAIVVWGPKTLRDLSYAEQAGRVDHARDQLAETSLSQLNDAFRNVARAVEPSVVYISVRMRVPPMQTNALTLPPGLREREQQYRLRPEGRYSEYDQFPELGNGSGWVMEHTDGKRYIITNFHVVQRADDLVVKFFDGATCNAEVVGGDPLTDIAVLRIRNGKPLHAAKVCAIPVSQGDMVFAFGSPWSYEFSMSRGIVSGIGRQIGMLGGLDSSGRRVLTGYEDFIQTDAAINPGNSGGPLVNIQGEVIGMNTIIASSSERGSDGVGFAIPTEMILDVAGKLIDLGNVPRGYLGVYIQDLDPHEAENFGYEGQGVLVNDYTADSPARGSGLVPGDIITEISGRPVRTGDELRHRVARFAPSQEIAIKAFREGEFHDFKITLGALDDPHSSPPVSQPSISENPPTPDEQEPAGDPTKQAIEVLRKLGIEQLRTMTATGAARLGVPMQPGVIIEEVRMYSVAAAEGLEPSMLENAAGQLAPNPDCQIITHINGQPVANVQEILDIVSQADLEKGVRIQYQMQGMNRFAVLTLPEPRRLFQ